MVAEVGNGLTEYLCFLAVSCRINGTSGLEYIFTRKCPLPSITRSRTGSRRRRASWIAVSQQLHGPLEVGKQHGDLFALAFERTAGGEDFLREIGWGVGERYLSRGLHGSHSGDRSSARVARPDEAAPRIVADLWMGIEEFVLEIGESLLVQHELPLHGPIGDALMALEQGQDLFSTL